MMGKILKKGEYVMSDEKKIIRNIESRSTHTDTITMSAGGLCCGLRKEYVDGELKKVQVTLDRAGYAPFRESSGSALYMDAASLDAAIALLQAARKELENG